MPDADLRDRVERCARRCGERAWRLASALLRDREAAYDAVQQALLVAARKPGCVPADDPWPWFSTVLVHEVRNLQRKRRPRTNVCAGDGEEGPMGRMPAREPAPDADLERADEAGRLWAAVDALPADERAAALLLHLGGLPLAGAAQAAAVPRQTLAARAERGLERLARRLGREPRAAAGALALAPLLDPPGGLAHALGTWTKTALAAHAAAGGIAATAAGGALVGATQATWIAGAVLALGVAFVGGAVTDGLGLIPGRGRPAAEGPATEGAATADPASAPALGGPRLTGAGDAEAGTHARLEAENARLATRLAEVQRELEAARSARPGAAGAGGGAPTFTFGEAGRLDAVRQTDWGQLAGAARAVDAAVLELHRLQRAGKPAPRELLLRLQENTEKVRTYEYRTIDRLPTAAQHNGELTHPISLANLVAAVLQEAGKPLSAEQVAAVDRLGLAFDAEFARLREGWGPAVPRARRLLEEYRLKGRFTDDLRATLTAEQSATLVEPAVRGRAGLDLYDPTLMILHTSPVLTGADAAEIRTKLGALVRKGLGLPPDAVSAPLEPLLDAFVSRALRGVEAVPAADARHYGYAQGLQSGEATCDLVDGLLRDLDLPPPAREALLQSPTWYVPRLVGG